MKKCLHCSSSYPSHDSFCSFCDAGMLPCANGFTLYAPRLANKSIGFPDGVFEKLFALEEGNFWFKIRNQLIIWALGKYYPNFDSFLEIGCGTGYVLSGIANAYPNRNLHGSEISVEGLSFAKSRQPKIKFMQMDARAIPFLEEFDCIGAFDVLEHIEEDEKVLSEIHTSLKLNGIVLLTVPQHAWLWSAVDDYACHVRRYSKEDLHNKVRRAGFEILRSTSFIATLLPLMYLSRLLKKNVSHQEGQDKGEAELSLNPCLNTVFEKILLGESRLIQWGLNFRIGGSRLLIGRKV